MSATTPFLPTTTDARDTPAALVLELTRTFHAPRALVWQALTDPAMAKHWMGPRGFETTHYDRSNQPGGRWRLCMEGVLPGHDRKVQLWQGGVLRESVPPERLVYTFAWEHRGSVGLRESPHAENLVTIELEARGDDTILHFRQEPFATETERDGHNGGWAGSFERLAELLATMHV